MTSEASNSRSAEALPERGNAGKRVAWFLAGVLLLYLLGAYVVMPAVWIGYVTRHPSLDQVSGITHTKDGIPGDPVNVALLVRRQSS